MKNIFKIVLVLLFLVGSVYAKGIGSISMLRGEATIVRKSADIEAKILMQLEDKDFIKTAKKSKIQLTFEDKTVVTLGSNTDFSIEQYLYKHKKSKLSMKVNRGSFKVITGKIGKLAPKRFLFKTRASLIGIRGTIFAGEVGMAKDNIEYIACIKGSIDVTSLSSGKTYTIEHGEMIYVNSYGKVEKTYKLNKDNFTILSHLIETPKNNNTSTSKIEVDDSEVLSTNSRASSISSFGVASDNIVANNTSNDTANIDKTTKDEKDIDISKLNDSQKPVPRPNQTIDKLIEDKAIANYSGKLTGISNGTYKTTNTTTRLNANIQADMDMRIDFGGNNPLRVDISNQKLDLNSANVNGVDMSGNDLNQFKQQLNSSNHIFTTSMNMNQTLDKNSLKLTGTTNISENGFTTNANLDGTFKDKSASGIKGSLNEATSGSANGVSIDRTINSSFDLNKN